MSRSIEIGAKTKRVGGGEEQKTNPCQNCTSSQQEFYRGCIQKGQEMIRTGQEQGKI
jgi:hypothetical protein